MVEKKSEKYIPVITEDWFLSKEQMEEFLKKSDNKELYEKARDYGWVKK